MIIQLDWSMMSVWCGRSCDLDEWSQEQLDIMKVSGNGVAATFFKGHGVSDSQMQVPIHLPTYLPIYLIYLPTYLPTYLIYLTTHLHTDLLLHEECQSDWLCLYISTIPPHHHLHLIYISSHVILV